MCAALFSTGYIKMQASIWYSTLSNFDCSAPLGAVTAYRSFATTVSQLKICDFSGETFKGFEVL